MGLSEETLTAITNTAEWVEFHSGEVVIEVDSEITHVYFLITGRVQSTLYDPLGKEIQTDTFVPGLAIGLIALGSSDRSLLHVEAIEPSTAIRLTLSDLLQLAAKHADFQLALFRLAVNAFKRYVMARSFPSRSHPSWVLFITPRRAVHLPVDWHVDFENWTSLRVLLGDDEQWKPDGDIPFKLFSGEGQSRQDILKDWALNRRLLIDVRADHSPEAMARLLSYVDIVLWCVRPQDTRAAVLLLQGLEKSVPRWRDKIRIVWILDNNAQSLRMYRSCMNSPNETLNLLLMLLGQTKTAYCSMDSNASFIICEASRSVWRSEVAQLEAWLISGCSKRLSSMASTSTCWRVRALGRWLAPSTRLA